MTGTMMPLISCAAYQHLYAAAVRLHVQVATFAIKFCLQVFRVVVVAKSRLKSVKFMGQ